MERRKAVKTVKHLFKKCKDSDQSEYLALPVWRTFPPQALQRAQRKGWWKAVQNTTTNSRQTVTAKVWHRRRGPRTTGSKAAPEVSLQSTQKTSWGDLSGRDSESKTAWQRTLDQRDMRRSSWSQKLLRQSRWHSVQAKPETPPENGWAQHTRKGRGH